MRGAHATPITPLSPISPTPPYPTLPPLTPLSPQARIAEDAGAVAVMALERIPADIKADGGVARSSDPSMIKDVMDSCSVPVMAKARIGHFYEAKILQVSRSTTTLLLPWACPAAAPVFLPHALVTTLTPSLPPPPPTCLPGPGRGLH